MEDKRKNINIAVVLPSFKSLFKARHRLLFVWLNPSVRTWVAFITCFVLIPAAVWFIAATGTVSAWLMVLLLLWMLWLEHQSGRAIAETREEYRAIVHGMIQVARSKIEEGAELYLLTEEEYGKIMREHLS